MEHKLRKTNKGIKSSAERREVGGGPLHMVEWTGQLLDHWRARLTTDRLGRIAASAIASLSRSSRESASRFSVCYEKYAHPLILEIDYIMFILTVENANKFINIVIKMIKKQNKFTNCDDRPPYRNYTLKGVTRID